VEQLSENIKKVFIFILITTILGSGGCILFSDFENDHKNPAFPEKTQEQKRTWPHNTSDLSPDPKVLYGVLDNGFAYVLMQNPKPEGRVRIHLNADAGSFHETDQQRGVAHFLEHMLFCGTRHFPPGQLVKYFQRIGMKFGPDVNGSTGFYNTTYDLDLPKGDAATLAEGLLVMRDFAAEALLEPEEISREKKVILAEKRTRDNPDYRTFKETFSFELPATRIAQRMPIGTKEVIENTDRTLLKNFYETWYRPERLTLIVVGDFHPEIAQNLIKQRFSDLAPGAGQKQDPDFGNFTHKGIKPFYHHESEAGSTRVAIETMMRKDQPRDCSGYQKNRLLSQMADQIVQHRLDRLINQPNTPFTGADIYSGHYLKYVKAAEISARCAPENWEKSLVLIEQTLRSALEHGFSESEVIRVKKEFETQLKHEVKTSETRKSSDIASQILYHLNNQRVFQSPGQRLQLLEPVIKKATAGKLHEIFTANWAPSHRLVMVTGNADLTKGKPKPEDKIFQAYEKSTLKAVEKFIASSEIQFPYLKPQGKQSGIKTRHEIDDTGAIRIVFENGVSLLIKKTDFTDNQVLAAVSFGYGQAVEPADKPALSEMAVKVVNSSGLGKITRDELLQVLAGTNTDAWFDVEEDKFVIHAESTPEETGLMFELLYAFIKDPGFRKPALDQAAGELSQQYNSLSHSVQGAMALEGRRFFAGGDSRFGFPGLEEIEKIRLKDIRAWLKPAFENAPIEIAVVGDLNPDKVIEAAAGLFGKIPERKETRRPSADLKPRFPEGKNTDIYVPTRIPKALLVKAYPTTHIWNIHETRRLSVLSDIFSDRMRIRIREKLGASYSQGAYNFASRLYENYGLLAGYAIIAPDQIKTVENSIAEIAADLYKNGVTQDELIRALEPTLTGIREQIKTNDYWLNTVLKGAGRHPAQLKWSQSIEDDYRKITPEEISRTAAKWLDPENAAVVRIMPKADGSGSEVSNLKNQIN